MPTATATAGSIYWACGLVNFSSFISPPYPYPYPSPLTLSATPRPSATPTSALYPWP